MPQSAQENNQYQMSLEKYYRDLELQAQIDFQLSHSLERFEEILNRTSEQKAEDRYAGIVRQLCACPRIGVSFTS